MTVTNTFGGDFTCDASVCLEQLSLVEVIGRFDSSRLRESLHSFTYSLTHSLTKQTAIVCVEVRPLLVNEELHLHQRSSSVAELWQRASKKEEEETHSEQCSLRALTNIAIITSTQAIRYLFDNGHKLDESEIEMLTDYFEMNIPVAGKILGRDLPTSIVDKGKSPRQRRNTTGTPAVLISHLLSPF